MKHQARKRFGQHFLQDDQVIFNIVAAINPQSDQHLVEIGPGKGALTHYLLHNCRRLDLVELDRDLIAYLKEKHFNKDWVQFYNTDALKFDFSKLSKQGKKLRIIGNLPYNISTPLLFRLLHQSDCIEDMHFMLQKEIIDRLCAEPGNKTYGRITVILQYFCRIEKLFDVHPESFYPCPKVTSTVIRLSPHAKPPVDIVSFESLNQVLTQAFLHRRKTLRNNLKSIVSDDEIQTLGIDPNARAESLSLEEFARLSKHIDAP